MKLAWDLNDKELPCEDLRARIPGRKNMRESPEALSKTPSVLGAEERPLWMGHSVGRWQEMR